MKAFLLAAGIGSRLKPLTDRMPKCLVPIHGKPLLSYWLSLFERSGVKEVLINLHHLPEAVDDFLKSANYDLKIHTVFEPELVGSAGTIRNNFEFVEDGAPFLICYADNLTNVDLKKMIESHHSKNPLFTLGLFYTNRPHECGIAELDDRDVVIEFVEKPKNPKSNLAGAGIYISNKNLINYIPDKKVSDMGFDVIPKLVGKMQGYIINGYFLDIGTIENYERACHEWPMIEND